MARRGVKAGILWSRGRQRRELDAVLRGGQEIGVVGSRCNRPLLLCSGNLFADLSLFPDVSEVRFCFTFHARKVFY